MGDVTQLLQAASKGDPDAGEKLLPLVYDELRRIAARRMAGSAGQTLQPTALVHEAWLRLGGDQMRLWQSRSHFLATAATAMRSILVDRARRRKAGRHGGGQQRVSLSAEEVAAPPDRDERLLAVHEALDRLAAEHPEKAELVKLRYFGGLSIEEASAVLGISEPTAKRWWAWARGWLGSEIKF